MQLRDYGVVLDRLTEKDLELVRLWRTSPEISQYMIYRDTITPEMQVAWFASLDPRRDFYFVIEYQGIRCGLADVKSVDWAEKSFASGIFMTQEYWGTDVPLRVAFCVSDFAFSDLGLEVSYCKVLKTNTRAIRYNRSLGYQIIATNDAEAEMYEMRRDKSAYMSATSRLRKYLKNAEETHVEPDHRR